MSKIKFLSMVFLICGSSSLMAQTIGQITAAEEDSDRALAILNQPIDSKGDLIPNLPMSGGSNGGLNSGFSSSPMSIGQSGLIGIYSSNNVYTALMSGSGREYFLRVGDKMAGGYVVSSISKDELVQSKCIKKVCVSKKIPFQREQ